MYTNPDPRAYPVSSYSYLIVPTTTVAPFTAAKGVTLSKFILYMVCAGQQKAAQLGYSPLPENLVQDAFNVVQKIPGHVNPPPINQCDNPTIKGTFSTTSDSRRRRPPRTQGSGGPTVTTPGTNPVSSNGELTGIQNPTSNSTPAAAGGSGAAGAKARRKGALVAVGVAQQPGQGTSTQVLAVATGPVRVPPARDPLPLLLYVVAVAVALVAIFGPPALSMRLNKNKPT